jgi:hypothetical protein
VKEIPRIEQETKAYQLLHQRGSNIVLRSSTEEVSHTEFSYGDVNCYSLLISDADANLVNFEHLEENATEEVREQGLHSLRDELVVESGRGAGFVAINWHR